jgi:hypothetical protein
VLPGDQAGHVRRLVARVTLHDRLRLGHHSFGEPVGDRVFNENPECAETDLP